MENLKTFFVGTYTTPGPYIPEANGKGILSCTLDLDTGEICERHLYKEEINTTYLTRDQEGHLFATCDNFDKDGEVRVFNISEDTSLQFLSGQSSHGTSSCHIEYDTDRKLIFISSYSNGQLSIHGFDGLSLTSIPQILSYSGSGPNVTRQESSHIHQAILAPNKEYLYACDLGSDTIWLHDFSEDKLQVKKEINTPSGSGPRHLVCHPSLPYIYVFCELDATLLTYKIDPQTGILEMISQIDTLPKGFMGEPAGAAIRMHPSTKSLYVSNRNHNSISVFSISQKGELRYSSNFSVQGKEPRDFNIDPTGQWLLCANQNSHSIVPIGLDPESGLPIGITGPEYKCGTPVCILF